MTAERIDITIEQGTTFAKTINWYGGGKVVEEIASVTVGCPTTVTVTSHGLPSGTTTPVSITDVKGARSLNVKEVLATYVDANTFTVDVHTSNEVYVAGTGCLTYFAPKDLTSWTAAMDIRENIEDTETLVSLTSSPAAGLVLTAATGAIAITITSAVTADLDFSDAVYDLELTDSGGAVTRLVEGGVSFVKEVTR